MTPSARNLIIANVATLVVAVVLKWDLGWLMWPFWMQSVIIGYFAFKRMMSLENFSTEGLKSNGRPVPETEAGKRSTAFFFLAHFGIFHLVYLFFLLGNHGGYGPLEVIALVGCGLGYLFSQRDTYAAQHAADLRGRPNLGALMFLPYLRVVPMHLGVMFGGAFDGGGVLALTAFMVLKTIADVGLDHADRKMAVKDLDEAESTRS